jgi:hypothetical protein
MLTAQKQASVRQLYKNIVMLWIYQDRWHVNYTNNKDHIYYICSIAC